MIRENGEETSRIVEFFILLTARVRGAKNRVGTGWS